MSDARVLLKNVQCIGDEVDSLDGLFEKPLQQELDQPLKVFRRRSGQDLPRHLPADAREASGMGSGRLTVRPRALAFR